MLGTNSINYKSVRFKATRKVIGQGLNGSLSDQINTVNPAFDKYYWYLYIDDRLGRIWKRIDPNYKNLSK